MTDREKIEILQKYRHELEKIEYIECEILFWRSKAERMTVCYGGAGSSGGRDSRQIESAILCIDDLISQLADQVAQAVQYRLRIDNALDAVPDSKLRHLLYCRYIAGETWDNIAESMSYTVRNVHRLHGNALELLRLERHSKAV